MGCLHNPPTSRLNDQCKKESGKIVRARGDDDDAKEIASSKHNRTEAHRNSKTVAACTGFTKVQARWEPNTKRRKWTQGCLEVLEAGCCVTLRPIERLRVCSRSHNLLLSVSGIVEI